VGEGELTMDSLLFDALNRFVEPAVRSGCGSPGFVPAGLVVLETKGRVSGRARRVPLMAASFGEVVVVSTVRGARSQWLANARKDPDVRYWLHGKPRHGRAFVVSADDAMPQIDQPVARKLAGGLDAAAMPGVAFAIIVPAGHAAG
jgi:deazaflavin-dependent oxidoreductase (nitroreductase family)